MPSARVVEAFKDHARDAGGWAELPEELKPAEEERGTAVWRPPRADWVHSEAELPPASQQVRPAARRKTGSMARRHTGGSKPVPITAEHKRLVAGLYDCMARPLHISGVELQQSRSTSPAYGRRRQLVLALAVEIADLPCRRVAVLASANATAVSVAVRRMPELLAAEPWLRVAAAKVARELGLALPAAWPACAVDEVDSDSAEEVQRRIAAVYATVSRLAGVPEPVLHDFRPRATNDAAIYNARLRCLALALARWAVPRRSLEHVAEITGTSKKTVQRIVPAAIKLVHDSAACAELVNLVARELQIELPPDCR
jgi:hypothetical protein